MNNLLDYTLEELQGWMKENNESAFRAKQIISWIYKGVTDFEGMRNIPKTLITKMKENFTIDLPEIVEVYKSEIDGTEKFLLAFKDGNLIESVLMRYKHGNSICISTQVGCRMGCKFCASTIEGRVRNLTCGEILSEVIVVQNYIKERISNIVLMGSGEPLDNFENTKKFLRIVNDKNGLNIGYRHITLSTCGIAPKMRELADLEIPINLALSLHSPYDEKRKEIMPIANAYPIKDILDACKYYIKKTNRRVTIEYSLIKGVNDSEKEAQELIRLLKGMLCHVNLIPVNNVEERDFKRPDKSHIYRFRDILEKNNIPATVRISMGSDIGGACGQLRRKHK